MLVLGIPIFDTLLSIFRRFLARRGIMSPDDSHFHHVLLRRGLRQHHVAIVAYCITLLVSGFGLFMMLTRSAFSVLLLISCLALLLTALRITGAFRVKETLEQIRKRKSLLHEQYLEHKRFEESRLQFQNAQTYEQWWECMCKAAKALDFSRLSLEFANQDGDNNSRFWTNGHTVDGTRTDSMLQMKIPFNDQHRGDAQYFKIDVETNGSLESAGRAALFARLADENRSDSPPPDHQEA